MFYLYVHVHGMCQQRGPTSTSAPDAKLKQLTWSHCVAQAVLNC